MEQWYVYSDKKSKFVKISKTDLAAEDIVCCKNGNGFKHIDNSTVFVVIHPETDDQVFRVRSLITIIGAIQHAHKEYGLYFLPHELDQYICGSKLNEDLVDVNWGLLTFRSDAKDWLDHAVSNCDDLLNKACSD